MKPYGREKNIKGGNNWKIDYHPSKGYQNWWEGICSHLSRSRMKQLWSKDVENEIISYKPCGGCGATNPRERCINCFHDFGDKK